MKNARIILVPMAIAASGLLSPATAQACAACFGKSDSSLAQGMNWGIFSLMIVILAVLASIAGFFIYVVRRAAKGHALAPDNALSNEQTFAATARHIS